LLEPTEYIVSAVTDSQQGAVHQLASLGESTTHAAEDIGVDEKLILKWILK
jgi:hypothetical protein